jgi:hypothetical protein
MSTIMRVLNDAEVKRVERMAQEFFDMADQAVVNELAGKIEELLVGFRKIDCEAALVAILAVGLSEQADPAARLFTVRTVQLVIARLVEYHARKGRAPS